MYFAVIQKAYRPGLRAQGSLARSPIETVLSRMPLTAELPVCSCKSLVLTLPPMELHIVHVTALFFLPNDAFCGCDQVDPSLMYRDTDPLSPPFEKPSDSMRERAEGSADRPVWWGKPFAEARGFADWEKPRRAPC